MGFEKINARRKKLKEEREARIKSEEWQAERKKYIQYMYNKYPDSQPFTEANKRIFAVPNYAIENIKDYKHFATLMLLAKQTIGTQSYDEEYITDLISIDSLSAIPSSDRPDKIKRQMLKTLLEMQEKGIIRTEPTLTAATKTSELFCVYFDKDVSFSTFDKMFFRKIILSDDSVSNKLKMMRVLASVCAYMFYQDPKGPADSEKPINSVCYANIDKLAETSGMNERATQTFLDKLVELEVLAKFRVNWGGNIKNYYSKREESYYLIKYIEEQLESGEVKYVEDDIKELSKTTKKQGAIKTEVNQLKSVISNDSITIETAEIKHEETEENKETDSLKEFAKFLRENKHLAQHGYDSTGLYNMFQQTQEDKREQELVAVGVGSDYCFDDDDDFEDLF